MTTCVVEKDKLLADGVLHELLRQAKQDFPLTEASSKNELTPSKRGSRYEAHE